MPSQPRAKRAPSVPAALATRDQLWAPDEARDRPRNSSSVIVGVVVVGLGSVVAGGSVVGGLVSGAVVVEVVVAGVVLVVTLVTVVVGERVVVGATVVRAAVVGGAVVGAAEVVTGAEARRELDDAEVALAVAEMQSHFVHQDICAGIVRGIGMLAEHARQPRTLHAEDR